MEPTDSFQGSKEGSARSRMLKALLICGLLSSLLYVAMNAFIPMLYPGYNIASFTVSELSAIGAPTRALWVALGTIWGLLLAAFGWGILISVRENRRLRVVGWLMIAQAIIGFFWPPMHQREVLAAGGATLTDTLHIAFTMVVVPLMLLQIGFGAAAFGKRFRVYYILTILILFSAGILTGIESPKLQANLPTPLIGVWERINIGVFMLWIVVLAILLLKRDMKNRQN